jgi:hypothetical protein
LKERNSDIITPPLAMRLCTKEVIRKYFSSETQYVLLMREKKGKIMKWGKEKKRKEKMK